LTEKLAAGTSSKSEPELLGRPFRKTQKIDVKIRKPLLDVVVKEADDFRLQLEVRQHCND
jgi:hypothetical protein